MFFLSAPLCVCQNPCICFFGSDFLSYVSPRLYLFTCIFCVPFVPVFGLHKCLLFVVILLTIIEVFDCTVAGTLLLFAVVVDMFVVLLLLIWLLRLLLLIWVVVVVGVIVVMVDVLGKVVFVRCWC